MSFLNKITTKADLLHALGNLPRPIVFTNGVFDILHLGHVSYLDQARSLGKSLVVGLNTDISVKKLNKSPFRPINPFSDRAGVLAGLAAVDLIVGFDEVNPIELLKLIKPEIYCKGGDYKIENLPEREILKEWNANIYIVPIKFKRSTTEIIRKISDGKLY